MSLKKRYVMLSIIMLGTAGIGFSVFGAEDWQGTTEQKLWGLMTVWSEARRNFPFFDQVPDLDWDATVRRYIPRVIASRSKREYYQLLSELAAMLQDGHTAVRLPPDLREEFIQPPIEIAVIDKQFIITRVGDAAELAEQDVKPGLEVLTIDGISSGNYLAERLRYYDRGTRQADESLGAIFLLSGPAGSVVELEVAAMDGAPRQVALTRIPQKMEPGEFHHKIIDNYAFAPLTVSRVLSGGVAYIELTRFTDPAIEDAFVSELEKLDLNSLSGMIIDLRYNTGGDSSVAWAVLAHLIDKPLPTLHWRTLSYRPGFRAWNKPDEWYEDDFDAVEPASNERYTGPLVVLIGPNTYSAAEDFLVPLDHANRAILVGSRTAGSTGNPLRIDLPGGGNFRVVTIRCTYPDGKEFVGIGIDPDVAVHATRRDILTGYDRVLAKGLEVVRQAPIP